MARVPNTNAVFGLVPTPIDRFGKALENPSAQVLKLTSKDAPGRHGLPDLPGCWCPPRPRAPARRPGRQDARQFLDLILQQKRIHIGELRGGYAYCCLGVPNAAELDGQNGAYECLLFKHTMAVLNCLKRGPAAQHRWVTLIKAQLS